MKRIALHFLLALSVGISFSYGQSGEEAMLQAVMQNCKSLKANSLLLESQRLYHRTGLAPSNPFIGYDYMRGTPAEAGNQIDFTATQSFEFPTVYRHRRELSESRIAGEESAFEATLLEVLHETRLVCIELVYLNKRKGILEDRSAAAAKTAEAIQKKFETGEATVLDLNRAEIVQAESDRDLRQWQGERDALLLHLSELNGGITLEYNDTVYAFNELLPELEELDSLTLAKDPLLKGMEWKQQESKNDLSLSKAQRLPVFEAGYHYQAILGQTFNGLHVGMSLPLWQNRHTVAQKESAVEYAEESLRSYVTSMRLQLAAVYERYLATLESLDKYRSLTGALQTPSLLSRALEAGEISTTEYFLELRQHYAVMDEYLLLEKEWQMHTGELRRHELYDFAGKY